MLSSPVKETRIAGRLRQAGKPEAAADPSGLFRRPQQTRPSEQKLAETLQREG
jgi:hypothetical protein